MLRNLFDRNVSTMRLMPVAGSNKETWQVNLTSLACAIHPAVDGDFHDLHDGANYQEFKAWCDIDADVKIGDRLIEGDSTYSVKGVRRYDFGTKNHKQLHIIQGL